MALDKLILWLPLLWLSTWVTIAVKKDEPLHHTPSDTSGASSVQASSSSTRPWSLRTVAIHMAAAWDDDISLAEHLHLNDPEEDVEATARYLAQLERGMHELAPAPDSLPWPSSLSWGSQAASSSSCPHMWTPDLPAPLHEHWEEPVPAGPHHGGNSTVQWGEVSALTAQAWGAPLWVPPEPVPAAVPDDENQGREHRDCDDPVHPAHPEHARTVPYNSSSASPSCSSGGAASTYSGSSSSSSLGRETDRVDWLELVRDKRSLRGEGITKRFGVLRAGVDRWHLKDGSVRHRLGEKLAADAIHGRIPPSIPEGDVEEGETSAVSAGSQHRDCKPEPAHEDVLAGSYTEDTETTTTPGDGEMGDVSSSSSSSEQPSSMVGFWRHGQWIGRPRTPAELRMHRGGGGEQRMQRKQQRMNDYLAGKWRPAWLTNYIQDKAQRDAAAGRVGSNLQEETTGPNEGVTDLPPADQDGPALPQAPGEPYPENDSGDVWDRWRCCTWPEEPDESRTSPSWSSWSSPSPAAGTTWTSPSWSWQEWSESEAAQGWQTWSSNTWEDWTNDPAMGSSWPGWGNFHSSWTTSSSTVVPNGGLFPEVREVQGGWEEFELAQNEAGSELVQDETGFMQLTGAERQRLQENGVPDHVLTRVESLLEALQEHQDNERGPESRWALQRLRLRAEEGLQCLDAILEVIGRRMMPRGFWPIERRPQEEGEQTRWFSWIRQWQSMLLHGLEHHLQIPLAVREREPSPVPLASSTTSVLGSVELEATESNEAASASSDVAASQRARSRSRSRSGRPQSSGSDETLGCDSAGSDVPLPPPGDGMVGPETDEVTRVAPDGGVNNEIDEENSGSTRTTMWRPPALPALSATNASLPVDTSTLPGLWRDPPLVDWSQPWGPQTSANSTVTLTSTTLLSLCVGMESAVAQHSPQCSTTTSSTSLQVGVLPFHLALQWGRDFEGEPEDEVLSLMQCLGWSSTTTTSSSSVVTWPHELVREVVASQIDRCSQGDVVDIARRLVDHLRRLRHLENLLIHALEEVLAGVQIPPHAMPFNAAAVNRTIWQVIGQEAQYGTALSSSCTHPPRVAPELRLDPWLPRSLDELQHRFPGADPSLVAGYRRRMWSTHVRRLYRDVGGSPPDSRGRNEDDQTLFIRQGDENTPVPNLPTATAPPERPFLERRLMGRANRRRDCRQTGLARFGVTQAASASWVDRQQGALAPDPVAPAPCRRHRRRRLPARLSLRRRHTHRGHQRRRRGDPGVHLRSRAGAHHRVDRDRSRSRDSAA